jgi:hypothetical protein
MPRSRIVGPVCAGLVFFVVAGAAAQNSDSGAVAEMSVEIAITRITVDQDGQSVGPVTPPTVFTVARTGRPGAWRTVMTYPKTQGPATRAGAHPLNGARIEFDESSGATRVYDAAGEPNALLSSDSSGGPLGSGGPAQWLDGLVATPATQVQRKRALHDTYGFRSAAFAGWIGFWRTATASFTRCWPIRHRRCPSRSTPSRTGCSTVTSSSTGLENRTIPGFAAACAPSRLCPDIPPTDRG